MLLNSSVKLLPTTKSIHYNYRVHRLCCKCDDFDQYEESIEDIKSQKSKFYKNIVVGIYILFFFLFLFKTK